MKVLSLFDGISCGYEAFKRAGIPIDVYYASEIDKYAIQISEKNHPDIVHIGDVTKIKGTDYSDIDMLIGGSPCQGFSFAGKQLNFSDPRSKLFFEFVRILRECRPRYFLLENVRMKKEYQDVISAELGVSPIMINSALVSAQNRVRLYWTNIPNVGQPKDRHIRLKDIIINADTERDKSLCIDTSYYKGTTLPHYFSKHVRQLVAIAPEATKRGYCEIEEGECCDFTQIGNKICRGRKMTEKSNCLTTSFDFRQLVKCGAIRGRYQEYNRSEESRLPTTQMLELRKDEKTNTLTTVQKDNVLCKQLPHGSNRGFVKTLEKSPSMTISSWEQNNLVSTDYQYWRKLTPVECERLQTLPDNYTGGVSNSQRYKCLGNGWTVDVIAHIFSYIKEYE
jgi:DNA-cytosine methyltransferase